MCVYNDEIKIKFKDGLYFPSFLIKKLLLLNVVGVGELERTTTFYIHNKIGWICSLFKAYSVVFIIYLGSKTAERGLVIGLSCLNGTK